MSHGALDSGKDVARMPHAYLALGGVDVDIHVFGGHLYLDDHNRVAALGKQSAIRLGDRIGEGGILDPAAVDKESEVAAVGPVYARRTDIAAYPHLTAILAT